MDRTRFLQHATAVGIPGEQAIALYERIRPLKDAPAPADVAASTMLRDGQAPFRDQTGLSRLVQVLVWLGIVLVIGAHAWWSTAGYEALGIEVVLALTLVWQAGFLVATEWARRQRYTVLVGGLAAVVAFYTPLTVYAIERLAGADFEHNHFRDFYPWISSSWVGMEVCAIGIAALLMWRYRRPFLTLPLVLFASFLVMDGTASIVGEDWDDLKSIGWAVFCGFLVSAASGIVLDYQGLRRFALWPHLASLALLAWALGCLFGSASLALFLAAGIAVAEGVWLARLTHIVAGALFGWIAISSSGDGAALPFFLMLGGIAFLVAAIWLSRSDSGLRRWLAGRALPAPQRDLGY